MPVKTVGVVCDGGLVHLHHNGVLIATHARRHAVDKQTAGLHRGITPPPRPSARPSASAVSVTRKVDIHGSVSFAGENYRVGNAFRRRQVQVAVVGDTVEISIGKELIRTHPVRHDRTREHGALANPGGRPRRINAASPDPECRVATGAKMSGGYRGLTSRGLLVRPTFANGIGVM